MKQQETGTAEAGAHAREQAHVRQGQHNLAAAADMEHKRVLLPASGEPV